MRKYLIPINATLSSLPLALSFKSFGFFKGQMIQQMDTVMAMQKLMGAATEDDFDDIKAMFLETNIYLLMLTGAVSALHSVFDALAFKNEISFWRNRNNMEGLSVRSVFMNVFVNLIVILYLLNNETSMMIIISNVIGLLIEVGVEASSHRSCGRSLRLSRSVSIGRETSRCCAFAIARPTAPVRRKNTTTPPCVI